MHLTSAVDTPPPHRHFAVLANRRAFSLASQFFYIFHLGNVLVLIVKLPNFKYDIIELKIKLFSFGNDTSVLAEAKLKRLLERGGEGGYSKI